MRLPVAVVLALVLSCASAAGQTVESDARIQEGISSEGVTAAATLIRARGYSCRTVSSMQRFLWSTGFNVCCQQFRYCYELADKGGNWIVTVK